MAACLFIVRPSLQLLSKNAYPKSLGLFVKPPNANQTRTARTARSAFKNNRKMSTGNLTEKVMTIEESTAYNVRMGKILGASALGLGALCYGAGSSVAKRTKTWPQEVKDHIKSTYAYFGKSIAITAASVLVTLISLPCLLNLVGRSPVLGISVAAAILLAGPFACIQVLYSLPYSDSFGAKHWAWVSLSSIMGVWITPLCLIGGPLVMRAVLCTAGVVGGLSAIGVCAPSEKILMLGGPLACGLGLCFAASLGALFLPPIAAIGAELISIYGGLLVFGGCLIYDTHEIVENAERYQLYKDKPYGYQSYKDKPYDPINESLGIYLGTINIFIRILLIMAEASLKKK